MKKLLIIALLAVLTACNKEYIDNGNDGKLDAKVMGVWKVTGFRMAGMNLIDECPLSYLLMDPESKEALLMFTEEGSPNGLPMYEIVELTGDKSVLKLGGLECPYELSESADEELLHLYPKSTAFIGDEAHFNDGTHTMNIQLYRDKEIEAMIEKMDSEESKGFLDAMAWLGKGALSVITTVYEKVRSNLVDPFLPATSYDTWANTNGWKPENWMSKLDGKMRVCCVNIPGSHDSCTSSLNLIGDAVSANCQTYSIMEQYEKGARYFDLRIGNELIWQNYYTEKRLPNQSDIDATKDLYLFHGNFRSDEKYKATLENLAKKIRKDNTEFVIVNTQWEDLSYGLLDKFNNWLNETVVNDTNGKKLIGKLKHITLDIANRLEKELNREYNNNLFIVYTPDLTVEQARGHIIIMADNHSDSCASDNPHCSYVGGWPNDASGYAKIYKYENKDSVKDNLYVQSIYEMKLSQYDLIDGKKKEMKKAAVEVTKRNNAGNWTLGFNATNANSGASSFYDLDTYEFAHIFNGYAFDMFVENMKSSEDRFRGGIISMDHYGASSYRSSFRKFLPVSVYGDILSWAVIESNFCELPKK